MRYYNGRSQIQGVPKTFTYQLGFDNCQSSLIVMLLSLKVLYVDPQKMLNNNENVGSGDNLVLISASFRRRIDRKYSLGLYSQTSQQVNIDLCVILLHNNKTMFLFISLKL